ncbi:MAG: ion transporter [Methanobrevibacter sp.]|nr:ion transporter [Methanosphaera sp.]MBR0371049.1 ion transporter [Methanobrevibacter sp.]
MLKINNQKPNKRMIIWITLHILIIIDIILITIVMLLPLPETIQTNIEIFDFIICIILLIEWSITFYLSTPKKVFLKQKENWIDLIASIPFDVLLPIVLPQAGLLRYLRLLKLLRVIALFNRFFNSFEKFIKTSNLDKILGGVFFTVLIFTVLLYIWGPTYDLFDDFYFVIVTLTTVGYGDVTPVTFNEKIISLVLIVIGIFIFSTITAGISSYLTERLISKDEIDVEEKLDLIIDELKSVREENKRLSEELEKLKKMKDNSL